MDIHFRSDSTNRVHTSFTVFVEGKHCGTLTMSEVEAVLFCAFMKLGCEEREGVGPQVTFRVSGVWLQPDERKVLSAQDDQ